MKIKYFSQRSHNNLEFIDSYVKGLTCLPHSDTKEYFQPFHLPLDCGVIPFFRST